MPIDEGTAERAREQRPTGLGAEISNRLVGLIKDRSGRGPTKAHTYVHDRVIVCVLEDALTRGEQSMAARGEEGQAIESRKAIQRMIRDEARAMVEELTGRRVVAFLSDNVLEPDVGVEAFVLE